MKETFCNLSVLDAAHHTAANTSAIFISMAEIKLIILPETITMAET